MIIADSDFTGEIIELDVTGKYTLGIIDRMRVGKSLFLLEDNAKACIIFDPIYDSKKWMVHILSKKDFRGKELWAFAYSAALWDATELIKQVDRGSFAQLACRGAENQCRVTAGWLGNDEYVTRYWIHQQGFRVVARVWVSPRANSAEPWVLGNTPTSMLKGRTSSTFRPSGRMP